MTEHAAVVIVGGGPNGLLLASELALAGVAPVVLDRLPERATEPKANGLVGRVVYALDRRGLYTRFGGGDGAPAPVSFFPFGGLVLDMRELTDNGLTAYGIPQRRMEEVLEQRAGELGVEVRRGHAVTALSQDADGVTIEVAAPSGGYRLTAPFLVGADGGRSMVRKWCGIDFPGITDDSFVSRSGEVAIAPPVAVPGTGELDVPGLGLLRFATFTRTEHGIFVYLPVRPGVYRVSAWEWDEQAQDDLDMSIEELRDAVCRVLGADLPISVPQGDGTSAPRRTRGINSRQAVRYRDRRVFLAGDAAHVHSGIGGPGLNLGMQDVLNLGWKLAAEIQGWAPDGLLDTYHAERHPVGERVIMHTRAQMALLSPGPSVTALRELFTELLQDEHTVQRLSDLMSGAEIRYDTGAEDARHPLIGTWMPDLPLTTPAGPARVAELLRAGRPVLLDLAGRTDLLGAAAGWFDRVDTVSATTTEPPADCVLIRPDGYVAWAGGSAAAADDLQRGLHTWFGASRVSSAA